MSLDSSSTAIKEEDYVLGPKIQNRATEIAIAGRNTLFWDEYARFWQTRLTLGRECWDYVVGDYFDQSEIDDYNLKEKLLINIPGLMNKVNSLESMQLTGRRNGIIVPVGAEDAPDKETINYVLQAIHRANNVPSEKTMAFTDAVVTGYPSFIRFDKDHSWDNGRHIDIYHEHWDSVLLDPYFSRQDLSDTRRIIRVRLMTKEEMKVNYPKRRDVIEEEIREGTHPKDYFAQQTFSAEERDRLYQQINSAQDSFNQTGKMYVIESVFFVYVPMKVWWDQNTGDYLMLPPEWDQRAVTNWRQENPHMKQIERNVRMLWTTASAQSGVLLENNRHWFQKNEFPCEMYIPKMWNNKPRGLVEFLRGTTKAEAIARIEHLHSLRQVNDDLVIIQENSIINAQDLNRERARTGGTIVTREGVPAGEAIQFPLAGKRENMGWAEFGQDMQMQTDRLSTNPNFEGMAQSSQESAKVVNARSRQNEKKFSPYMNTYHDFDLRVTRKTLMMIPALVKDNAIFRHIDSKNRSVEVEVNKVAERDMMTGNPTRIVNNLVNAKYDYVPAVTDDSLSAREFELNQFIEICRDILPTVPQEYWPELLHSVGNRYAVEFAEKMRKIQEEMKNQQPPPEQLKKTLSINSEDISNNKIIQEILVREGVLDPNMLQGQPAGQHPPKAAPGEGVPPEMAAAMQQQTEGAVV